MKLSEPFLVHYLLQSFLGSDWQTSKELGFGARNFSWNKKGF